MSPSFSEALRQESILLEGFGILLEATPAEGGRLVRLEAAGRSWLWSNPWLQPPLSVHQPGAYVSHHDDGGWDEIFPNLAAHQASEDLPWPDHGELWGRAWEVLEVSAVRFDLAVTSRLLPLRFHRTVQLLAPGKIHMAYRLTNLSDRAVPFTWAAHPLFSVADGARIVTTAPLAWWPESPDNPVPAALHEGRMPDLGAGIACKAFAPSPPDGAVGLVDGPHALRLTWDPVLIPHVGVWMNAGGWAGVPGASPYHNLALEPCLGPSDSFLRARELAPEATLLPAGEGRSWWLTIDFPDPSELPG